MKITVTFKHKEHGYFRKNLVLKFFLAGIFMVFVIIVLAYVPDLYQKYNNTEGYIKAANSNKEESERLLKNCQEKGMSCDRDYTMQKFYQDNIRLKGELKNLETENQTNAQQDYCTQNPNEKPEGYKSSIDPDTYFNVCWLYVGDKVGGWTIRKIEASATEKENTAGYYGGTKYSIYPYDTFKYYFEGENELEGEYSQKNGEVVFIVKSEQEAIKLPSVRFYPRAPITINFSNYSKAKELLGSGSGTKKIKINKYNYHVAEDNLPQEAEISEVVN